MVLFQGSCALLLLAAANLISEAAARSCKPCGAKDRLLVLFRSDEFSSEALPFCSSFLDLPASTHDVTVTPTVVSTVTETEHVTEVLTTVDSTSTLTTTVTSVPSANLRKRDVEYPPWLPTKYLPARVSSACHCLSVPLAVTTRTVSDEAVTITTTAAVTDTTTNTIHTTATAIATTTIVPPPAPRLVQRRALIQVVRMSNGSPVGYLYMSNGPAVTTDPTLGVVVRFNTTEGATTSSSIRLQPEGYADSGFSFSVQASPSFSLKANYGTFVSNPPTTPGSTPIIAGSNKYLTNIFTFDTATNVFGWDWIESDGTHSSPIYLYRVAGRLYPVGNVVVFSTAFGSVSASSRYEIFLKAILI